MISKMAHKYGLFYWAVCSLLLLTIESISAERIAQVKYFNTENGMLMHNSVESVVRDSMGFIWVGTNYGLNRLDGYHTDIYTHVPDDSTSISNNYIKDLFVDSRGRLWIGTIGGGLNRFHYPDNSFIHYHAFETSGKPSGQNVSAITEDHFGNIWIGVIGMGVSMLEPETGKFKHYGIERFNPDFQRNSNISNLHCDRDGNIWVGFDFDQNGIFKIDPEKDEISFHGEPLISPDYQNVGPVLGIDEMEDGTLLFTIWNGKLYKMNPRTDRHIKLVYGPEFFGNAHLTGIAIDRQENIWISTWEKGLFLLDKNFRLISQYSNSPNKANTLSSNAINDLYLENDLLWVSTREQGVNLLVLQPRMFNTIDPEPVSGISEIDAHSIATDGKGTIWVGSRGQGLWRYQTTNGMLKQYSRERYPGLVNNNILCLHIDQDGLVWMGTDGDFTGTFNPRTESFRFVPHFEGIWNSVYALAETDSFMWCGTWGTGIKKLNKKTLQYSTINFDTLNQYNNTVFDIEKIDNDLWISSYGLGLIRYHLADGTIHILNQDQRYKGLFPDETINDLYVDENKRLWLSTSGGGLIQFDPKSGLIKHYDKTSGLTSNVVQAFIIDSLGNRWISTNEGVTLMQAKQNQIYTFYKHNGLKFNHLNMSALVYDDFSKMVFVGSPKGLSFCSVNGVAVNTMARRVVITGLQVNGEEVKKGRTAFSENTIELAQTIWLDHTHDIFSLRFSSMEFSPSFKSRYLYKLQGFNDQWTEVTHDRNSVQFTNLDPGTYFFSVKASNNDGIYYLPETTIKIVIKPAFWQTLAFKLLLVLLLIALVGLFYYLRYKALINNQIKLEQMVKERTAEINRQKEQIVQQNHDLEIANQTKDKFFSIIGHDLKNPISIIDQFNELLLLEHQVLTRETTVRYYEILKKTSGQTIKLLDDLIMWARTQSKHIKMDKQLLPLELLFRNNFLQCEALAQNKKIKLKHLASQTLFVWADEQSIQTVLRNLTINAIKFSRENAEIEISASEQGDHINICVKDQGIGMSKAIRENLFRMENPVSRTGTAGEKGTGLGLIICKEFVSLNGGQLSVESEEGKGTRICFTLKKG